MSHRRSNAPACDANPVSPGQHTFRAEIVGTEIVVTVDGAQVANFAVGPLVPAARTGMMFLIGDEFRARPTLVRITAFATGLPPCPPTGDSVLDSKAVRDALIAALSASGPNLPPHQRKEHGGIIYRLPDGTYLVEDIPNQHTGAAVTCGYRMGPGNHPPGGTQIAIWHTHPHFPNDTAYNCRPAVDPPTGLKPYLVDPRLNGGGSDADWDAASPEFPVYVINALDEIIRLNAGVAKGSPREQNTNRWNIGSDARACLTRKP